MNGVKFDINQAIRETVNSPVTPGVCFLARSTIYCGLDTAVLSAVLTAVNATVRQAVEP